MYDDDEVTFAPLIWHGVRKGTKKKKGSKQKKIDFWADSDEEDLNDNTTVGPSLSQRNPDHLRSFIETRNLTENKMEATLSKEQAGFSISATKEVQQYTSRSSSNRHRRNNKLSKVEKQEKMLLKKMRNVSLSDDNEKDVVEKKLQKIKTQKNEKEAEAKDKGANLKKKTKKKKSVSFNETVTTIYTKSEEETEVLSKDENSNGSNQENIASSGSDEGIEQDLQNNNIDSLDHHQSFEMARFKISDLSKAERKKLKNKRKLEAALAIQKSPDEDKNLKKRKFLEDPEQENHKRERGKILQSPKMTKNQRKKLKKRFNFITDAFDNISIRNE